MIKPHRRRSDRRARSAHGLALLAGVATLSIAQSLAVAQGSQAALRFGAERGDPPDRVHIGIGDARGPGSGAPCDVGRAGFTVELWLRGDLADNRTANAGGDVLLGGDDWRHGNMLVDRGLARGGGRGFGLSVAGGFIRFGTGAGDGEVDRESTLEGDTTVLDGTWHHVACVRDRDAGTLAIYVDGVLDVASARGVSTADLSYADRNRAGGGAPWDGYLVLGASKHDAGPREPPFTGYLDELRVFDVARSAQEIASTWRRLLPPDTPGLVGDYRFEEPEGNRVHDSSLARSPDGEIVAGGREADVRTSFTTNQTAAAPVLVGPLPPGFSLTVLSTAMPLVSSIAATPDGRAFIGELDGKVWVYANDHILPQLLIHVPTEQLQHSSGLLSLCLDPDFAHNGWLYAYYTTDERYNRVGRFTVVGDQADPASEFVVWQNLNHTPADHNGGGLAFTREGALLIATGDQSIGAYVSDLTREDGKLLRVNPDGSIPLDNPCIGVPGAAPTIYAVGFRNPFRIARDPASPRRWVGDVGSGGPFAYEELDLVESGANYGWPSAEGTTCWTTSCSAFTEAAFAWRHGDPDYYYLVPQGCTVGGIVYRGTAFPAQYRGNLIYGDYANRWLRRLVLDSGGHVQADLPFVETPFAGPVVDMDVGSDGALYIVCFTGIAGQPSFLRLSASAPGNLPPVPVATVTPTHGPPPLSVGFDGHASFDPDHGPNPLAYDWDFGDGAHTPVASAHHHYFSAGVYAARLTVDDGSSAVSSLPFSISVGNAPVPAIATPQPGATYDAGDVIQLSGGASDVEDGTVAPAGLSWNVELVHLNHTHPEFGPVAGVAHTHFTVPVSGHPPENTFLRAFLTATDSDGLGATTFVDLHPNSAPISIDTIPSGVSVFVEGQSEPTPRVYGSIPDYALEVEAQRWVYVAGNPWLFRSWSDHGARAHTFQTPMGGGSLIAKYVPATVSTIHTRVNAANRHAQYAASTGQVFASPSAPHELWLGKPAGEEIQLALEFTAQIPRDAVILSAVIEVTAGQSSQGFAPVPVFGYDVADAPAFMSGSTTPLALYAPPTSAILLWTAESFTVGAVYQTLDLSAILQQIVDRSDWKSGNRVGFVFDGSTAAGNPLRSISNFDSASPPKLTVTYGVSH
jgi:glucose/arabinose dehydrogenase/PKD repeat protein